MRKKKQKRRGLRRIVCMTVVLLLQTGLTGQRLSAGEVPFTEAGFAETYAAEEAFSDSCFVPEEDGVDSPTEDLAAEDGPEDTPTEDSTMEDGPAEEAAEDTDADVYTEKPPMEISAERKYICIVLRPVKEEGMPDPDLSEEVRGCIAAQLSADELDVLDRLCGCVFWEYLYEDGLLPPGTERPAGESEILLSFSEDPEYVFLTEAPAGEEAVSEPEDGTDMYLPEMEEDAEAEPQETAETAGSGEGEAAAEGIWPEGPDVPPEDETDGRSYLTTLPKTAESEAAVAETAGTEAGAPQENGEDDTEAADIDAASLPENEDAPAESIDAEGGETPEEDDSAEDSGTGMPEYEEYELYEAWAPENSDAGIVGTEVGIPVYENRALVSGMPAGFSETAAGVQDLLLLSREAPKEEKELLTNAVTTAAHRKTEAAALSVKTETAAAPVKTELRLFRTAADGEVELTDRFRGALTEANPENIDWQKFLEPLPENDGMYMLRQIDTDSRGRKTTKETAFSVNRFGSVYAYDNSIQSLRGKTVQNVKEPLIISEYNPDPLETGSWEVELTHDGRRVKDVLYSVCRNTEENAENTAEKEAQTWYRYDYVVFPENFREDGLYRLTVASRDTAGNHPESNRYNGGGEIVFSVDAAPPELLEIRKTDSANLRRNKAQIKIRAFDSVGLARAAVYVDGTCVAQQSEFSDRHRAELTAVLPEDGQSTVRVLLEDAAGNRTDKVVSLGLQDPGGTHTDDGGKKRALALLLCAIVACAGAAFLLLWKLLRQDAGYGSV